MSTREFWEWLEGWLIALAFMAAVICGLYGLAEALQ